MLTTAHRYVSDSASGLAAWWVRISAGQGSSPHAATTPPAFHPVSRRAWVV
jgi:hypothetical protein